MFLGLLYVHPFMRGVDTCVGVICRDITADISGVVVTAVVVTVDICCCDVGVDVGVVVAYVGYGGVGVYGVVEFAVGDICIHGCVCVDVIVVSVWCVCCC